MRAIRDGRHDKNPLVYDGMQTAVPRAPSPSRVEARDEALPCACAF
jgi:hypothetical protein